MYIYLIMTSTKAISSFQDDQSDMFAALGSNYSPSGLPTALLSPSRGTSFAKNCLISVVSKMGIEIEVEYYEKDDEILNIVETILIVAKDVPLEEIFLNVPQLNKKFEAVAEEKDQVIRCYAGDIEGEEISLNQRPKELEYVLEAMRENRRPVLILCKGPLVEEDKPTKTQEEGEETNYVRFTGRTASGMVQDMLDLHLTKAPPSVSTERPLHSPERTFSSSEVVHRRSSGWKVPQEMYMCQEELVSAGETTATSEEEEEEEEEEGEEGESDRDSMASCKESDSSSISTCTSEERASSPSWEPGTGHFQTFANRNGIARSMIGISSSSPARRSRFFGGKNKEDKFSPNKSLKQKFSDPGYFTLRSSKSKSPKAHSGKRLSMKPRKAKTIDAEISSPSPVVPSSEDKPLLRQPAMRSKRGTRLSRDFSQASFTIPESSYSLQISKVNVLFKNTRLEVPCREHNTVRELKDAIALSLNKQDPDRCTPWKGTDFIITYEKDGQTFELFNEWQFLYRTALYQLWGEEEDSATTAVRVLVPPRGITEDCKVIYRISQLIGVVMNNKIDSLPGADTSRLRRISGPDQREAQWTRRILYNFVREETIRRDQQSYCLSMELASSSTSTILALKIPIDSKIKVIFHYKQDFSLVKQVKVQETADGMIQQIFPCLVACGLVENRIEKYTMQISGERSYIAGNHELIAFKDIRRSIIKAEPVNLSIKEKPRYKEDMPCSLSWPALDPFTTALPLHTDITRTAQQESEMQALSSWDRDDDFTLKIEQVQNLPSLPGRTPYSVIIEATLYHGDKPLCPSVTTTAKTLDRSISWKETMNFKIAKKNIPRAAKILFVVSEVLQKRESVTVKKPKFQFWGLTMVFDHQGMMFNGEHSMLLWRGLRDSKEEKKDEEAYIPNPLGPASNSAGSKAVTLTIKFDSYGFPMHFPSCSPQSWSVLLVQPNIANVAVRKQFQRLLEFIREGKLHSAVPAYIEKVNWGSLAESLEVYSLLDQIADAKQQFPVEIALKLLDCDFPDESVRGFATRVLEDVADERLEDFLLQLTQALKFEPYHDSLLARFLLKRALHNKRIGHFFFWYLKCEMVNPQYTTRFAVILEAYLTGCGEAMLKQFEHQVEMQTTLEEIAQELKLRCNDDQSKMQAMLPDLLEKYRVPQFEITPVYNPRIRLGNLRPNKCKIMGSKKKPQWLEMSNVDDTVLKQTPTRLILKIGDDLRQDMITLRMFSLFEKLWEEDGLDLALIPYGCIATGPDTGFIEVVRNARTIAEVSGVNNQTKLLEWIKSHQKNEFGEEDGDKVKAAIKTFVHSCAGYSVATYVLGIGDRHNDNIMITTSGNLFHIDFGHFLGNIKYCMGFKREWAPFVLTPDFVYVMGGEESSSFETYKNLCCRAFLTLRRHAELIINLFSLMRSTGIPELTCVEDTDYIRNALVLEKSEHEAEQMFRKVIKKCLDLKFMVQVMWKFHLLRKKGSS